MQTTGNVRFALLFLLAALGSAWWALRPAGATAAAPGPTSSWPGDGWTKMEIRDVVPLPEVNTHAVVLVSDGGDLLVPLFVDEETALSVALRLAHRRPPGPLAPELLSGVLQQFGGKITGLRVDGLARDDYTGSVRVQQGPRVFEVSARPTDALALAVEADVPVFASRQMIRQSGITREEIEKLRKASPAPRPPSPSTPSAVPGERDREL